MTGRKRTRPEQVPWGSEPGPTARLVPPPWEHPEHPEGVCSHGYLPNGEACLGCLNLLEPQPQPREGRW